MVTSKQALWAGGRDQAVEVNQRDLINKVLARYSGKFTVFRELLQNADDANARSVEIRFETETYLSRENGDELQSDNSELGELPDLKSAVVHRWTFKNNGILFRDQDWNRLKSIAEGNPDEEKIGAFGVGFYSLFSITEEPWVISGGQWMSFYWKDKKNQLYARSGTIPTSVDDMVDPWTTFQMTLREPGPIPTALDLTRFLISSITFMTHISEVSIYFDDKRLVRLSKYCDASREMPLLNGLEGTSPKGMMNVKSIKATPLHIKAEVVRWVYNVSSEKSSTSSRSDGLKTATHTSKFFSPNSDRFEASWTQSPMVSKESIYVLEATLSEIVLTIFAANVDVSLDKKMTEELLRSTLKKPPSHLRYNLIFTGKDEYESSVEKEATYTNGSVFQGLRADLEGTGSARVFIGHSTGQTTGIGGHMATRFIPTVERESIDLVDRNVAVWNEELLYVGGFLARSVYEFELDDIKKLWDSAAAVNWSEGLPDEEVQTQLRGRALHALKFFTFYPSTPSPVVSNLMETAFFACATTHRFSFITSNGVQRITRIHSPNPEISGFLRHLPIVPEDIANGAKVMTDVLRSRGVIKEISFVDVIHELHLRPLSEAETILCLEWWVRVFRQGITRQRIEERSKLLDALVVSVTGPPKKLMKLSGAQIFLSTKTGESIIPTDGPLPTTLLPMSITSAFDRDVLISVFAWKQLLIVDWLRHVTDWNVISANAEFDISRSAPWAERVLSILARAWPFLARAQEDVIRILRPMPCIPTSAGLKAPSEAYFSSVNSFRDLPIVAMPSAVDVVGNLELVLQSLGVRKHEEFKSIFERLIQRIERGDWSTYDLVKYLASISSNLTPQEVEQLQRTFMFSKDSAAEPSLKFQRYKAMDLYEPVNIFRELGLPVLDWGVNNQWQPTSNNAKFLFLLGLRREISLEDVLLIAASDNPTTRRKALTFFLDNLSAQYSHYNPINFRDLAFVPAVLGSEKVLAKPLDVYTRLEWAALGFPVVDPVLNRGVAKKLRLQKNPPTSHLVTLLKKSPPADEEAARQWFEVLSGSLSDFSPAELRELIDTPFVPVKSAGDKDIIKRLQPSQCLLGAANSELYSKLFAFVDFGPRANLFLGACGARHEPSVEDFVQVLLEEPCRIYKLAKGRENYLDELRNLAVNRRRLKPEMTSRMKESNILLGSRRVKKDGGKPLSEGSQEDWGFQDDLLQASDVVVVDDANAYRLFGGRIFCAPQEDILEELYLFLGSPRLSSLVKEHNRTSGETPHSKTGTEVRHLILERLPLFLHEHPQSSIGVSLDWLNKEKNFNVRVFGKLLVTRSLHHGDIRDSRSHEASAVAKREGNGPIELWLAGNKQANMYEISTSLCRIIFQSPKTNDSLLFMTILSTDLKALRQWGYDIDRILQQQKARRQAIEKAELDKTEKAEREEIEKTKIPITQTNIPLPPAHAVIATVSVVEETPKRSRLTSVIHTFMTRNSLRRNSPDPASSRSTSPTLGASVLAQPVPEPSRDLLQSPQLPDPNPTVTSPSYIANNIEMAIKACAPERADLLRNRQEMQIVLESLDEGYCHVTRKTRDLELVGSMGDIKIFVMPDLPEPESLIQRKHDVLSRFLYVLKPLVELYKIPETSLQVFADKEGQLISLNKNGCLVMNLRYFEAWHDCDVQRGDFSDALIYWYFMLAHGIAHNLIYLHNSEHEFYFSAICEAYLRPLIKLLSEQGQFVRQ